MESARLWIDNEACDATERGSFEVRAPWDDALVGRAADATEADVERAVASAVRAFGPWSTSAPGERERVLLRAADAVDAEADALIDRLIDESGSTIVKATYEVRKAAELLRTAAGEARRLYGDTFPNDRPHRMSLVLREPIGVVAAISPFNAPLALFAKMTVFALAAGNTVVGKPSEEAPLCALRFARILAEAGLPPGVFNVLTGRPARCAVPLTQHRDVGAIAFTGSTEVGRRIGVVAAERVKRVQLELGGKNPLIVLRDADLEHAAAQACAGAFTHAGQICMASARVLVEAPLFDAFLRTFARHAEALSLGELRDPNTAYGPLIHDAALAKIERHVRGAVAAGARLVTGGAVHRGRVYRPTILTDVPHASEAWCDETFGPLVCVEPVRDLEHALALANDTPFGLSAGVLTNDLRRGLTLARRIRAGSVHVGMHSFQSDALAPIGGYGQSGIGRSGGKYSIESFTETKWVSIELTSA